ncbi:MFS transporter [bacterium]|nr:MFS transporter [bacterium]
MSTASTRPRLTSVQWLICTIASIGFAFDIYELLMLPLIVRPALQELAGAAPGSEEFRNCVAMLFYVPALVGGIFGLLGGYMTDRLGRRRVLTWSILCYAVSAFAAGYSTNFWMLLFFRSTTFVGVCVEFVAAVAWLAELFDDPQQREKVIGYTQAFSSIGGLLVAIANGLTISYADSLPAIALPEWLNFFGGEVGNGHAPWRYTLMSGLIPAIPLIFIRPFLPESPKWQEQKDAGTLKRPSLAALFSPELRRTTVVTTVMFACSYGAAFGAIQHVPRIIPRLSDVKESTAGKPVPEQKKIEQAAAANYTKVQEAGGLFGRFCLALLVVRLASWRRLIRTFVLPGVILMPLVFYGFASMENNPVLISVGSFQLTLLHCGLFLAGLLTVAQFSFWGNYLPHVYPVHLRGTGESFAANIGGRLIGTSFAAVTTIVIQPIAPGDTPETQLAMAAAIVATFVYLSAAIASRWLPEPVAEVEAE